MSGHLGELAAALVDEQLGRDDRDRALAHLAGCPRCQQEIEVQRRIKACLDRMGDPSLPTGLLDRLQSMQPASGGSPPPASRLAAASLLSGRPLLARSAQPQLRTRRLLVGAASVLLVGGGAAYAAGQHAGAPTRPALDVYTVQHGAPGDPVPLHDPAVTAVTVGLNR